MRQIYKEAKSNDVNFYIELGDYFVEKNPNKTFLAYQNALLYCKDEEDEKSILDRMGKLKENYDIRVKNTAIIIVSFNALYLFQKCIESIRENLLLGTYRIIVVDNNSSDDVIKWLDQQEDIITIKNDENKGFACACNQGAKLVEDEDIFLLNNDARLTPNALFWAKMGLYESEYVGATGCISNYAGNNQNIEIQFELPSEYIEYGEKINIPMENPYETRVRLSGFAMLIKSGLWETVGGMDEQFSPGYFEDDDLSMKILKQGLKLVLCKNSFIYHAGSQSFANLLGINELLQANYIKFINKYGFYILDYVYPSEIIYEELMGQKDKSINILFVGAGLGANLFVINDICPGANIIGIEKDLNIQKIASKGQVVFASIEELKQIVSKKIFHYLIIDTRFITQYSGDEWRNIQDLCMDNCRLIKL